MTITKYRIAALLACAACGGSSTPASDGGADDAVDAPADADEPGTGARIRVMAVGVRAPAIVELAVGGEPRTLAVTEDGAFRFPGRYVDGTSYVVTTADPRCVIPSGTGTIAGTDVVIDVTCDGVVELAGLSFSVPAATTPSFDPEATSYVLHRPFLLEPTDPIAITATARYPALATLEIDGAAATSGAPAVRALGAAVTITLRHASGLARTYTLDADAASSPRLGQEAYAKSMMPAATANAGAAVALSGDTLVVGAPGEDGNSGAAYVFRRSGVATWTQEARIKPSLVQSSARFGSSVAVAGNLLIVGAHLEDVGTNTDAGAAYLFERTGTTWAEAARIQSPSSTPGQFGRAVAIDGTTAAVGAPAEDVAGKTDAGAVHVFVQGAAGWTLQQSLAAPNAEAIDLFGQAVALSTDTLVVGAPFEDGNASSTLGSSNNNATDAGAGYVFLRTGTAWNIERYLKASNASAGDHFGAAVAIDGNLAAIGAPLVDANASATNAGAAYVESRSGTVWSELAILRPVAPQPGDSFGIAIDVDANHVIVGTPFDDSNATGIDGTHNLLAFNAGAAYIFRGVGADWTLFHYVKPSNPDADDNFGTAVALDGDSFAVGAPLEDSNVGGVNPPGGQGDVSGTFDAGAIYIFR